MQSRSPFFDEFAKAIENAMGLAQTAGSEAKAAVRAQADRIVMDLDLVRREELEAMRAAFENEIGALRSELARLNASAAKARPGDDAG